MVSGRAWEDFPGKYACVSHKVFVSAIPSGCDAHLTFVRKLPKIVKLSLLNVNGKRYFSRRGEKFPSASVLDRYVVVQLIPPMVLGIAVFSALGVSMGKDCLFSALTTSLAEYTQVKSILRCWA